MANIPDKQTALTIMRLAGFEHVKTRDSYGVLRLHELVTPDHYRYILPRVAGQKLYAIAWQHFLLLTHNAK